PAGSGWTPPCAPLRPCSPRVVPPPPRASPGSGPPGSCRAKACAMNKGVFAAVLLLGFLLAHGSAAAEQPWCKLDDPAAYRAALTSAGGAAPVCPPIEDPQTLPDQLVLPMPCGEQLVLRKVVVAAATLLDQEIAYLGVPPALAPLVEGARIAKIAGSFLAGSGPRDPARPLDAYRLDGRSFYIGKYVVTEPQYRAIALIGAD